MTTLETKPSLNVDDDKDLDTTATTTATTRKTTTSQKKKKDNNKEDTAKVISSTKVEEEKVEEEKIVSKDESKKLNLEVLDFTTLTYPIFCCSTSTSTELPIIAVGGGGGTSKTGVPNGITLFKWGEDSKFHQLETYNTLDCIPLITFLDNKNVFAYPIGSMCYIVEYLGQGKFKELKSFDAQGSGSSSTSSLASSTSSASSLASSTNEKFELRFIKFSKNGERLVTIGSDNVIKIWSYPSIQFIKSIPTNHTDEITDFDFNPSSTHIATTSRDKSCKIINILSGKIENTLKYKQKNVDLAFRGCRFSNNGLYLYTAQSLPRTKTFNSCTVLSKWEFSTGKEEFSKQVATVNNTSFELSPNGKRIAIGTADSCVSVYDIDTFNQIDRWEPHTFVITGICFSPDTSTIFSTSADYTCKSHKIGSSKSLKKLDFKLLVILALFILLISFLLNK